MAQPAPVKGGGELTKFWPEAFITSLILSAALSTSEWLLLRLWPQHCHSVCEWLQSLDCQSALLALKAKCFRQIADKFNVLDTDT